MPLKNPKAKGSRNERKTMRWLEDTYGCLCMKSGGSLGMWDVIGIGPLGTYLVQVKSNRWPGKAEMEKLQWFHRNDKIFKLVHRWDDRASEPQVRWIV